MARKQQAKASSWRDHLKVHPAAELFPRMSENELRALGEDIKKNGLAHPIALWRADPNAQLQLLDGRNRLDGIERAHGSPVKIVSEVIALYPELIIKAPKWEECDCVTVLDSSVDPYAFVISANIHRRHLTTEQKRDLIAALLKAQPEKSDRQIAKIAHVSHPHVGKVRTELEKSGDVETVTTRTDTKGRQQPAKKPANKSAPHVIEPNTVERRDDIGPSSGGEIERLRARVDELEAEKRRLEIRVIGLESENAELRARLPRDDGFDVPASLRRAH
jgi:hypothetical protein